MKIGFIGIGNMGGAILAGYSGRILKETLEIYAFDLNEDKLKEAQKKYNVKAMASVEELVCASDIIVLGIKPNTFEDILPKVASQYGRSKIVVSMAAGVSINFIEEYLGKDSQVVRIMPNTPAAVGEAMTAVCKNSNVNASVFPSIVDIFTSIGKVEVVEEELIHCVIGVSGSSPAYTYMYIDALAKAAQKNGMDYEQGKIFAAQSVLGAAKMVLEMEESPEQLRINVCSPGGTTIEAVNTLMEKGFEEDIFEGFQAAVEKSKVITK